MLPFRYRTRVQELVLYLQQMYANLVIEPGLAEVLIWNVKSRAVHPTTVFVHDELEARGEGFDPSAEFVLSFQSGL